MQKQWNLKIIVSYTSNETSFNNFKQGTIMTANVAFLGKRHVTNSNKPVKTFALTHWTLANCCRAFDIDEQYMNYDI